MTNTTENRNASVNYWDANKAVFTLDKSSERSIDSFIEYDFFFQGFS